MDDRHRSTAAGQPPSHFLLLANASVTTSGDAWQFVEIEGKRYSHVLDPRTGVGLTEHSRFSVVAPTGMAADALSTAVGVLGIEQGLHLIAAYAGCRRADYVARGRPGDYVPVAELRRLSQTLILSGSPALQFSVAAVMAPARELRSCLQRPCIAAIANTLPSFSESCIVRVRFVY